MNNSHFERDTNSLLHLYYREISVYHQLSPQEILLLAQRMQEGDSQARKSLIECNLRLVVTIAKSYHNPSVELLDLIQEGNLGLIEAVDRFDPMLGNRFSSYAVWWIKKRILLFLGRNEQEVLSLDAPIFDEDDECVSLADVVMDECNVLGSQSFETMEESMIREQTRRRVREQVEQLPVREREVLMLLYGIGVCGTLELSDVAKLLGISQQRVSQLRDHAFQHLSSRL